MRRRPAIGLAALFAATALLSGCSLGAAEGPNAAEARAALEDLGQRIVTEVGGDAGDAQQGTVRCEDEGGRDGVDWTSTVAFDAPDFLERIDAAEQLLVDEGYEVSTIAGPDRFSADGPNGELVVLTNGELTLITGCVIG